MSEDVEKETEEETEEEIIVIEDFDDSTQSHTVLKDIKLSNFGLDMPFLKGTGIARIKGDVLDLSDLRNKAEMLLREIAEKAKATSRQRLDPIGEWMQEFITKRVPSIGKYYAKHVFAAGNRSRGNKMDQERVDRATARVRTFIYRERAALDTLLRATDLELTNIAEITFWDTVEKAIPIFLNLGQLALTHIVPGVSLA